MASAGAMALRAKPTLHVEVRLKSLVEGFVRTDLVCEEVGDWLAANFPCLSINEPLTAEGLNHRNVIESINVVEFTGAETTNDLHRLSDVQLEVQAYALRDDHEDGKNVEPSDPSQQLLQAQIIPLPSKSLDGLWESLIFDTAIAADLLRFLTRMMSISRSHKLSLQAFNWNRLLLLHGPPGTGKTTLCLALAQKLTVRLGRHFTQGKLININSHSLLSKFFSESGKLVAELFQDIQLIAEDEETLICVLIDEVESLTGAREKSVTGNECNDALRATNQLLTGLDKLRMRSNVVVFCTSNLLTAIDPAFLDRVDIKEFIPDPGEKARYEILRSCFNELVRYRIIYLLDDQHNSGLPEQQGETREEPRSLPAYDMLMLHSMDEPESPEYKLWDIARQCEGMSGRTLRRLPFVSIVRYALNIPCAIHEAFYAILLAVKAEINAREMQGKPLSHCSAT